MLAADDQDFVVIESLLFDLDTAVSVWNQTHLFYSGDYCRVPQLAQIDF